MADHVDATLGQWALERPDLDHSPVAVVGRLSAAARLGELRLREDCARHDLDGAG